jgi:glycosyltransferase involved in cell wall biosynthesis
MIIGIEAERANHAQKTGVEHYAQQLILHLAKIDSHNQYVLYLRTKPQDWFLNLPKNFRIKILGYGPIKFPYLWTQLRISWEMLVSPPDLLFIPAASLPLIHPRNSFVTLHDVAWRIYPEAFQKLKLYYLEFSAWFATRFAKGIIAVSQATRADLLKFYRVVPGKISVVPHGYEKTNHDFSHLSAEVSAKLPEKYILFLSTLQPRKNVPRLIDAFAELKTEHPELPHKLVIVGKPGWKFEPILDKIHAAQDIVIYLGHVADKDRWPLYHKADLFIHPSLYEGFGMWLLEAFECEVPAAVSNISSMPEIGGDAALYFDPTSKSEIKETIRKILQSPELRIELVRKGKIQLQKFSWEKCAEETLAVFESNS